MTADALVVVWAVVDKRATMLDPLLARITKLPLLKPAAAESWVSATEAMTVAVLATYLLRRLM